MSWAFVYSKRFHTPLPYEKPVADVGGADSRRINIHNRVVCKVFVKQKIVRVSRMWAHYE